MAIPTSHIQDAHKLTADAEIELWDLQPTGTSSHLYFKADNTVTWQGNQYLGLPLSFSGESKNAEGTPVQPQLTIGQPDIDLSLFKGLIFDGTIDNARLDRHTVLLADIIADNNVKNTRTYRIKRVGDYGSTQIVLNLAAFSAPGATTLPFRQYIPPFFPFVRL